MIGNWARDCLAVEPPGLNENNSMKCVQSFFLKFKSLWNSFQLQFMKWSAFSWQSFFPKKSCKQCEQIRDPLVITREIIHSDLSWPPDCFPKSDWVRLLQKLWQALSAKIKGHKFTILIASFSCRVAWIRFFLQKTVPPKCHHFFPISRFFQHMYVDLPDNARTQNMQGL